MKRYTRILLLLFTLAFLLSSCSDKENTKEQDTVESEEDIYFKEDEFINEITESTVDTVYGSESGADDITNDAELLILCSEGDPAAINRKLIKGEEGVIFEKMLLSLKKTGEKSGKISDEDFYSDSDGKSYAPDGTFFIETNGKLYRISADKNEICTVEKHYGEGDILSFDTELIKLLYELWNYYPRNTLYGTFDNGMTEMKRVFENEGTLELDIKKLEISNDSSKDNDSNSITVTLTSKEDITLEIEAVPQCNKGEFAKISRQTVTLEKNMPKEVKLSFGGWQDKTYELNVMANTARIHLKIVP